MQRIAYDLSKKIPGYLATAIFHEGVGYMTYGDSDILLMDTEIRKLPLISREFGTT